MDQDPFEQVVVDTGEQIDRLAHYFNSNSREENDEVYDILKDVEETIQDLEKSCIVMQRSGQDVSKRETQVHELVRALRELKAVSKSQPQVQSQAQPQLAFEETQTPDQEMSPMYENPFQEQMLREQDTHLDSIHHTMTNLHSQAQTMGEELQDQGQLLDEMDGNMDTLTNKLSRGRRQLEWVYEKNKEKFNDCCIVLLIIALIVLLVLAFIA
ncbi:hypothetical protein HG535_0D05590 [Zygotorulaspora mrakii]|uniref:t-SNARE affecting a late Golgi compartment protein 1 n=1 Tax=Zygotorulaspora mrakii TaxID=42260 RepID=A0A7H9B2K5_ZYGMR|nr:uncharacterized protein HG535_0D05590 [Zygotorulaspora mrakii]QLG72850.1 hypothetical protein HG535_0D05590 [Zygotorulaspora mrakii]